MKQLLALSWHPLHKGLADSASDTVRSKFIYLLTIATVFLFAQLHSPSARANGETAPANSGYWCAYYCGSQPLPSGQEACEKAVKGANPTYTDAQFTAPDSCSYIAHPSGYPQENRVTNWVSLIYVCPGGETYDTMSKLGYYAYMSSPTTCACLSSQKYFADAVGPKRCIGVGEISKPNSPPIKPSDNGPCPSCVGQPINPGTGNMWHIERDYVSGTSNSDLTLQRIYNSNPQSRDANALRSFGARWTQLYDSRIQGEAAPAPGTTSFQSTCWIRYDTRAMYCDALPIQPLRDGGIPPAVSVLLGDGKKYMFVRSGASWIGDADNGSRLTATFSADNSYVTGWTYFDDRNDSAASFDTDGRLVSISSRGGRVQRLTYSDGSTNNTSDARIPFNAPACSNVQVGDIMPAGRLICVTDNWGRQLQFEYDVKGRIVKTIAPDNQPILYEYDGPSGGCAAFSTTNPACIANNLTKVTFADGNSRVYYFNEAAQMSGGSTCSGLPPPSNGRGNLPNAWTGLVDENGARYISWTYNCSGQADSSQLANGAEKVTIAYENYSTDYGPTGGAQMAVTHYSGSPQNPVATTSYWKFNKVLDSAKITRVSQSCAECGGTASTSYDVNGNVSRRQEWNTGNQTTYTYDLTRNLEISRVEGSGVRTISTQWHPIFRLPTKIAEPKRISTFTYDASGNLLTKTIQATNDATGSSGLTVTGIGTPRTSTYSYNQFGQLLTVTGPRADGTDVTRYTYDAATGNLLTITNAVGHITTYSDYDANGRVGTITAPNGVRTMMTYNRRGWLESQTVTGEGRSLTTSYVYDGVGQLKSVTLPNQSVLRYTYDDAHRLVEVDDSLGNSIQYTLDIMGNRTQEIAKDSGGNLARQTTRVFDSMKRLQSVTGAAQ